MDVHNIPFLAICIALGGLGAIYSFDTITRRTHCQENTRALSTYEDEDGRATPATIAAYKDLIPRLVLLFSLFGTFVASIGGGFYPRWYPAAAWLLVLLQAAALNRIRFPVLRFNIGLCIAFQSVTITLYSLSGLYFFIDFLDTLDVRLLWAGAEGVLGLLAALAALSLPRRPDVERDGRIVDSQYTISALSRYTMAWGKPLLDKALAVGRLEYEDLPLLDSSMIAPNLHQRFRTAFAENAKSHLFYIIFKANQRLFLRQWGVTILESFANFSPQLCMFKILELLEKRDTQGGNVDRRIWVYVAGLVLAKMSYLAFNGWVSWIRWCLVEVTVSIQLSIVIFDKSMRMEDVKRVGKGVEVKESWPASREAENGAPKDELTPLLPKSESKAQTGTGLSTDDQQEDDDSADETSQNAINLYTVAIPKITQFAKLNFMLLTSTSDTILGMVFLIFLIGWQATLAGLLVMLIMQPINKFVNQYYSEAQTELMDAREKKTHVVTEALHGIKMIKISAIESQWQEIIMDAREHEIRALRKSYIWDFALTVSWMALPILFSTVSLAVYAYLNGGLTPSVAFTALAVFSTLEAALNGIPMVITELISASISCGRIQDHLNNRDQSNYRTVDDTVKLEKATITWPIDGDEMSETFVLRDINVQFPNACLSVIHGRTGTGKSLLLASLLGEANLVSGKITTLSSSHEHIQFENIPEKAWIIPHSSAFVAQIPWIENATIKNNILYGLPLVRERYDAVLYASAMDKDLQMLTDGENTEVGASGINLSGGQKWRLTFARALYSRAGILIMDDIFSAVDSHVGRHIFEHGLCGKLATGRTRILVTHHIGLVLSEAAYVVEISRNGSVRGTSANAYSGGSGTHTPAEAVKESVKRTTTAVLEVGTTKHEDRVAAKFVEDEHREQGRVSLKVYQAYVLASGGYAFWIFVILSFALVTITTLGRSYWIEIWSRAADQTEINLVHRDLNTFSSNNSTKIHEAKQHDTVYYLLIYLAISLLTLLFTGIKIATTMIASLRASKALFRDLTISILRAKVRWLDTTPIGRVLNRFMGDFEKVDDSISNSISWAATFMFQLTGIVVASLFVSVWALLPAIILLILCVIIARIYIKGARDMKRLESNAKSPVLEHYTSSLLGLATIRSFGKKDESVQQMYTILDEAARASWNMHLSIGWMEFRQGGLGILFALIVACGVIALPNVGAPLAGFALGFALEYAMVVVELILKFSEIELEMNAVERVSEFINMPVEEQVGVDSMSSWPTHGLIEVKDLEVGYADDLPAVLKDVNFTVKSRERVGIVGRTGSGKSSLTLAIFRMLEARSGSIRIDNIDISTITLHDLRSRLAIIPQDPVLFSGTLRSNIDPFNKYSDGAVFDALRRMQLLGDDEAGAVSENLESANGAPTIVNVFHNLNYQISRGGLNLSQGQRQLICLARALISRPKVLILDEATSAVDMKTDTLIQRCIREDFAECTLLVIAHRLSTISDFDKVLVLGAGRVLEFGAPKELFERQGSFFDMISQSGEKESIEAAIRG